MTEKDGRGGFEGKMSRYLAYSTAFHFGLLFLLLISSLRSKPPRAYYAVQFFGGASGFGTGRLEPAPPPAPAARAKTATPSKTVADEKARASDDENRIAVSEKSKEKKTSAKGKTVLKDAPRADVVPDAKGRPGGRGTSPEGKGDSLASKEGPVGGVGNALEIGGFGPGGGAVSNVRFPYTWYVNLLYKRLWENWAYKEVTNKECTMTFVIQREGGIFDIKVDKTSGDGLFDQIAWRAVSVSSPLPPLPEGFPDPELRVYVRFRME